MAAQSNILTSRTPWTLWKGKKIFQRNMSLPTPVGRCPICHWRASLVAQRVKHLPAMWETRVQSLGREVPLEKEMATHSSILAWRIPWMEEPDGLQSQRVWHDWASSLHLTSSKNEVARPKRKQQSAVDVSGVFAHCAIKIFCGFVCNSWLGQQKFLLIIQKNFSFLI